MTFDPVGVLPVDKPVGPTSHDIVGRARKALGLRRIGHTGTLDPFASGLLLLCLGPATRLSQYLTALDKRYVARARLGVTTAGHDREGEELERNEEWRQVTRHDVAAALEGLRGTILQRPPRLSSKKVGGEPAHRRARRGEEVELEPVEVRVSELDLVAYEPPDLTLRLRCSSGTYVRALARDLGEALGVGAHLRELRRTSVGVFHVEDALTVEEMDDPAAVRATLVSPAGAVQHLPVVTVDRAEAVRLCQGQFVVPGGGVENLPSDVPVAILREGRLVAVGERQGSELRPRKVFGGP